MKSFRRRRGEGITAPVGMREAGSGSRGKMLKGEDGGVEKESEKGTKDG